MLVQLHRRGLIALAACTLLTAAAWPALARDRVTLRLSTPATETDQRSVALATIFGPAVAAFADYQPHYNASLVAQGSELEAIAAGDLEMSITSAQELATFMPEFSIFATGYVHQDAAHQLRVFNDALMCANGDAWDMKSRMQPPSFLLWFHGDVRGPGAALRYRGPAAGTAAHQTRAGSLARASRRASRASR